MLGFFMRLMNEIKISRTRVQTVEIYLAEGADTTIDLTGLTGTCKSAFVMCNAQSQTTNTTITLTWEGDAIAAAGTVIAVGYTAEHANQTKSHWYEGTASAPPCFNVTSSITMNASNTYTLQYSGGARTFGAILVVTYVP